MQNIQNVSLEWLQDQKRNFPHLMAQFHDNEVCNGSNNYCSMLWFHNVVDVALSGLTISLSLQKVRNFAHFLGIFKYRIHHEILNLFEYSLFACRHRLIKYAPAVSDVVYRHLEVVVGALKKTHLYFTYLKKKKKKKKKK